MKNTGSTRLIFEWGEDALSSSKILNSISIFGSPEKLLDYSDSRDPPQTNNLRTPGGMAWEQAFFKASRVILICNMARELFMKPLKSVLFRPQYANKSPKNLVNMQIRIQ